MDLMSEGTLPEGESGLGNIVDEFFREMTPEVIYANHEIGRTFINYARKHPNEFPGLYVLGVFKPDLIESVIERLRWRMGW